MPAQYHTEKAEKDLREKYEMLSGWIERDAKQAKEPRVEFSGFQDTGGYQLISNGSVSDTSIPWRDSYNWHLQNTSQWLFAFGLVFDKERLEFSIHT